MSNKKSRIESLGMYVIRHRYLVLVIVSIFVLIGFFGLERLEMDSSNESIFSSGDLLLEKNKEFKEIFGNEEFIYIMLESEDVFTYDVLQYIQDLCVDIEENLPFVREVTSLTNIDLIESQNDDLIIEKLIDEEIPSDKVKLEELKEKVLAKKTYVDRIISSDAKKTGIIVFMDVIPESVYAEVGKNFNPLDQEDYFPEDILMAENIYLEEKEGLNIINDPRKIIAPALDKIISEHRDKGIKTYITGVALLDYEVELFTTKELVFFGLLALIISLVLMILLFRSFQATIGPFLIIVFTLIILFGFFGWFNIKLNIISVIIPTLILVISVSYSIHVINHFQYAFERTGSRKEAVRYVYQETSWPIFVTSLTTAMGFLSFLVVSMDAIRIIGLSSALGVFLTFILVMIILPILLSFGKDREAQLRIDENKDNKKNKFRTNMAKLADFVSSNVKLSTIFAIILIVFFSYFSFQMKINSDFLEIVGENNELVKETRHITDNLGALYSYEVLIEFPEEDMLKDADVLQEINKMSEIIEKKASTISVLSLVDLIKEMNMIMNENKDEYYTIPDSSNLIAQYLLLYEMSGGDGLEELLDFAYEKTHITVFLEEFTENIQEDFNEIIKIGEERFPEGSRVSIVGDLPIMARIIKELTIGQAKSVLSALLVITIIMIIILKSFKLGLLSMIPNIIPIIVITGLMGFLQIALDMITILVIPMIIGIAVDDTVHYFIHFKKEYERHCSYHHANRETFKKIAKAVIFTSTILILGFALFGLSEMQSLINVGILAAAGILAALVADLFITPAIMVFVKPLGKNEEKTKKGEGLSNEV